MPPFEDGEKTEAPTPRKRADARRSGQVAKSQDLVVALMLLALFGGLYFFALPTVYKIGEVMRRILGGLATLQITEESVPVLFGAAALAVLFPSFAAADAPCPVGDPVCCCFKEVKHQGWKAL